MTTPQLDINSTQINATHNEMADIVKMLASRAGNHVGQIARLLAEKAMLEEENARLKAKVEQTSASNTQVMPYDGKPHKEC